MTSAEARTYPETILQEARKTRLQMFMRQQGGKVPFDILMQESLYGKSMGFYHSSVKIAPTVEGGSFQTYAHHPLFAQLFFRYLEGDLAQDPHFFELAGGMGTFKSNFLEATYEKKLPVNYTSIDISDSLSKLQYAVENRVVQASALNLPFADHSISGVFFMNELFDALPFKVVKPVVSEYTFHYFEELLLTLDADRLVPEWVRIDNPAFQNYWERQLQFLRLFHYFDPGYELKSERSFCVNLFEEVLMAELDRVIKKGKIIIVDYGNTAENLVGTNLFNIRMYPRSKAVSIHELHRVMYDVDLTTDVNFTNIILVAQSFGWKVEEFLPQGNFFFKLISKQEEKELNEQKEKHFWWNQRGILQETKARSFKILVLSK